MRFVLAISMAALISGVLAVPGAAIADEGMYPLDDVKSWPVDEMKNGGLKIAPEKLLELRKAVAKVAAGGSGSFVSEKGLLVTNHHVAYRCLAALDGTSEHKGIMEKGHVAITGEKEIPCPGYDLMVVEDVRDVTKEVKEAAGPKKGKRRFEAIRLAMEDQESACQKEDSGYYCDAEALDGGRAYHMMVYRLIKDVRLVYAPEAALGKFGGDVDNWRYPRHTADFTFLRAYVGPDGKGAAFSGANVPFEPLAHLDVATGGVAKGDQVLVVGFPARTKRNYPSATAKFASGVDMPTRKQIYEGLLEVLTEEGKKDELSKRRYQGLVAGLNNAGKYYGDVLQSFEKWKIVEKREARDAEVEKKLVKRIDKIYGKFSKVYAKFFMLQRMAWMVRSVGTAYDIALYTEERAKPDRLRKEDAYKSKNMYKTVGKSDLLDEQITIATEKAILEYVIRESEKLPPKARLKSVKKLLRWGKKAEKKLQRESRKSKQTYEKIYEQLTGRAPSEDPIATAVDLMYAKTALLAHGSDRDEMERALYQRKRLFYNDRKDAKRFKDPLLNFAKQLVKEHKKLKKGAYRALEQDFDTELRPKYAQAISATYPDANFQVRLSFGKVDDYTDSKDGKVHSYMTGLDGVIAKDKGEDPFIVPQKVKDVAAGDKGSFVDAKLGDVPVNFTCTLDTTGGNSGSGVLDSSGRLVGLLFDGTPESQLSDWQYLADEQRSIVMDIRYALFLAQQVHGAKALLDEMGVEAPAVTPGDAPADPPAKLDMQDPFAE